MEFIYHKKARGRLTFEFYTRFVAHIRQHINKITHLKVLKECLVSVESKDILI